LIRSYKPGSLKTTTVVNLSSKYNFVKFFLSKAGKPGAQIYDTERGRLDPIDFIFNNSRIILIIIFNKESEAVPKLIWDFVDKKFHRLASISETSTEGFSFV